jgi:Ser/Thr protein kinase RdoA (MazF antagonist)
VAVSHTNDVVETVEQAYEAARQFGRFTRLLSGIKLAELKITIPDFHNLSLRYQQFLNALETGDKNRIKECNKIIKALKSFNVIVKEYEALKKDPAFKLRVTHHDTKISNVLFDNKDKGLCVIDLDTMMPGYFISDLGDMMRTYLCPVSEEEADFSKIEIREDIYHAIVNGYYSEMKNELTPTEVNHFFYAGKYMIYMQSLRFITDYLNHDSYYGAKYSTQNKVRGENQLVLLEKLVAKETELNSKNILKG